MTEKQTQTLEQYKRDILQFIKDNGREPTAIDFDTEKTLPSARTIQRICGGLKNLRTDMGLNTKDFTKGLPRQKKAKKSMDDCIKEETELFIELLAKYGEDAVSSPTKVFLWRGITADFRFKHKNTTYIVDVFKPNTTHSFRGCVGHKNRKYDMSQESYFVDPVEMLFVCLNEEVMVPIKNRIPVISIGEFRERFL